MGLGGGFWRRGHLQDAVSALSGVCGTSAGGDVVPHFVRVAWDVNNQSSFKDFAGFGSAGESQDGCAKDLDTFIVGGVHANCNWNQIILAKAKRLDHF